MPIGHRMRAIREAKNLSQGDIEKGSGLLRTHLSRFENDHSVPSIESLEKLARALEVPVYQLLYEPEERPRSSPEAKRGAAQEIVWGTKRNEICFWQKLRGFLAHMKESDRQLLLHMAQKMAKR